MGGAGTGGAIVDAGTGGMIVDAPYDGPTGITPYAAGQLVITEIMADTNDVPDDSGEWFELYNPSTTDTYDLFGCDLSDSGNHNQVLNHVIVSPMSYVTLARFGTTAGGFPPELRLSHDIEDGRDRAYSNRTPTSSSAMTRRQRSRSVRSCVEIDVCRLPHLVGQ